MQRYVLVRSYGVEGEDGDANQRVVLGNHGERCGSQSGCDGANSARLSDIGAPNDHSPARYSGRDKSSCRMSTRKTVSTNDVTA